jgi:hypothetical protein
MGSMIHERKNNTRIFQSTRLCGVVSWFSKTSSSDSTFFRHNSDVLRKQHFLISISDPMPRGRRNSASQSYSHVDSSKSSRSAAPISNTKQAATAQVSHQALATISLHRGLAVARLDDLRDGIIAESITARRPPASDCGDALGAPRHRLAHPLAAQHNHDAAAEQRASS